MTTDAVGGVWTYSRELADALAPEDVEVVLAVLGPPPPEPIGERHEAHARRGRLEWQEDPWDDVAAAGEWLLDLAAEVRPDVVHLNDYAHGALDWPMPSLVVGHSCVLSWWEAVRGEEAPREWERYRTVVRAGLRGADDVVAPTAAMLGALRRLYALGERGNVIANGIHPHLESAPKEPFVLGAGRLWDPAKALDALDGAARGLEWPVLVAGDAGGREPEHAVGLGHLGRAEVHAQMRRAAIFAHPARYEPFGLAPLEAGLAGCALVLGDLPSLREVWGDDATYVAPGDPSALRAQLDALIADRPRRECLGAAARGRALSFGADRMARAYAARYRSLSREALPA